MLYLLFDEITLSRSLFHLMSSLPREEGVLSLWKGHLPAQYLSISYGVSTFAVFEVLTKLFYSKVKLEELNRIELDAMSPLEAFDRLREIVTRVRSDT